MTDPVEQILDEHAAYYIRQTMRFFEENGESPALSKDNENDLKTKAQLDAHYAKLYGGDVGASATSSEARQPKDSKSVTWPSPQEQSLWKLLHEEKYDLTMRLTWFCDGPEHGFIKGRVLARYLEKVTDLITERSSQAKGHSKSPPTPPKSTDNTLDEMIDTLRAKGIIMVSDRAKLKASLATTAATLQNKIAEARIAENEIFMARLGRYTETAGVKLEIFDRIKELKAQLQGGDKHE